MLLAHIYEDDERRGEDHMNERDTLLTTWLAPLMGLLAMVVAGLVDLALYRLQLHVRSFFQPPAIVVLGAISLSALVVAAFLVAVAWVSLRTSAPMRSAGWLFLLLGLPVALAPLLFGLGLLGWLPFRVTHISGEYLRTASAFLTVLGLALVFRPGNRVKS